MVLHLNRRRGLIRGVCLAGALGALALTAVACGESDDGATGKGGEDVRVGVVLPLTGDLASQGVVLQRSIELATEQARTAMRESGDERGVTIEVADDETTPQAGQRAASKLVSDGANCLVAAQASSITIPIAEAVATRQQVPQISTGSTSPEITTLEDDGFLFRVVPSDALQGEVLAQAVEESLPKGTDSRIALAGRNDAYGEGIVNAFREAWESRGGKLAGEPVLFDPEQAAYDSEADRLVASNPDGYLIIDFEEQYAQLGAALLRTGKFDAGRMFTADSLAYADGIPKAIPADALRGARGTRPASADRGSHVEAFDKLYTAGGNTRGSFDAQAFDAALLCVLASVAADSTDGAAIRDAVSRVASAPGERFTFEDLPEAIRALREGRDIDYEGVAGPVDFDDNGDVTAASYDVFRYGDDGKFEVVDRVQLDQSTGN